MTNRMIFRRLSLIVLLVLTVYCPVAMAQATGPVTIIDLVGGCSDVGLAPSTNLAADLGTAGYTVSTVTSGVPASLTGVKQVWDLRCRTALTAGEISTYTAYLAGGGSLFLMGEWPGYAPARNPSLLAFIAAVGGGTATLSASTANNSQTVHAPFTGPNPVTAVSFRATGGLTAGGTGSYIATDGSGLGSSIVYSPGTLSGAPQGSLIIVFDVNFLDNSRSAGETAFARNLIAYLAAPTPITPSGVPAPPSVILVLAGGAAAAFYRLRRRA